MSESFISETYIHQRCREMVFRKRGGGTNIPDHSVNLRGNRKSSATAEFANFSLVADGFNPNTFLHVSPKSWCLVHFTLRGQPGGGGFEKVAHKHPIKAIL